MMPIFLLFYLQLTHSFLLSRLKNNVELEHTRHHERIPSDKEFSYEDYQENVKIDTKVDLSASSLPKNNKFYDKSDYPELDEYVVWRLTKISPPTREWQTFTQWSYRPSTADPGIMAFHAPSVPMSFKDPATRTSTVFTPDIMFTKKYPRSKIEGSREWQKVLMSMVKKHGSWSTLAEDWGPHLGPAEDLVLQQNEPPYMGPTKILIRYQTVPLPDGRFEIVKGYYKIKDNLYNLTNIWDESKFTKIAKDLNKLRATTTETATLTTVQTTPPHVKGEGEDDDSKFDVTLPIFRVRSRKVTKVRKKLPTKKKGNDLSNENDSPTTTKENDLSNENDSPTTTKENDLSNENDSQTTTKENDLSNENDSPTTTKENDLSNENDSPTTTKENDLLKYENDSPTTKENDLSNEYDSPTTTKENDLSNENDSPKENDLSNENDSPTTTKGNDLSNENDSNSRKENDSPDSNKRNHSSDSKKSPSSTSTKGNHSSDSKKRKPSSTSTKGNHSSKSKKGNHSSDSKKVNHSSGSKKENNSSDSKKGNHSSDSKQENNSSDSKKGNHSSDWKKRNPSSTSTKGNHSSKKENDSTKSKKGHDITTERKVSSTKTRSRQNVSTNGTVDDTCQKCGLTQYFPYFISLLLILAILPLLIMIFLKLKTRQGPTSVTPQWHRVGTLREIYIYPVKSCGSIMLHDSHCTPLGLKHDWLRDRFLMVVDQHCNYVSAKDCPILVTVEPCLRGFILILKHDDMDNLHIDLAEASLLTNRKIARVCSNEVCVVDCGQPAAEWFTRLISNDRDYRLAYYASVSRRKQNHEMGALSNDAPYHLISEATLEELNHKLTTCTPVSTLNFRPNFVVEGATLCDEYKWKTVKICNTVFEVIKPCTRCQIITIDPNFGCMDKNLEPLTVMKRSGNTNMGLLLKLSSKSDCGMVSTQDSVFVTYKARCSCKKRGGCQSGGICQSGGDTCQFGGNQNHRFNSPRPKQKCNVCMLEIDDNVRKRKTCKDHL